jgi:hypothetical protein
VHTDEDTSLFVREQKQEQYRDLKHALQVMGRIDHPSTLSGSGGASGSSGAQRRRTLAGYQPLLRATKDSPVSSKCSLLPEHMVLMYLLENNRLLLSSINQMKLEAQVSKKKKTTKKLLTQFYCCR